MNKVTVVKNKKSGLVLTPSKNPEYGFIRLQQVAHTFDENNFVRNVTKSALIKGRIEDLKSLGYAEGKTLDGQIVVTESLTPSNPNNLEQDIKVAGDSGVVCSVEGNPIYRTSRYTMDASMTDTMLAHDNVDAIKAAQVALEAEAKLSE